MSKNVLNLTFQKRCQYCKDDNAVFEVTSARAAIGKGGMSGRTGYLFELLCRCDKQPKSEFSRTEKKFVVLRIGSSLDMSSGLRINPADPDGATVAVVYDYRPILRENWALN